jgi:hypothetical protein
MLIIINAPSVPVYWSDKHFKKKIDHKFSQQNINYMFIKIIPLDSHLKDVSML